MKVQTNEMGRLDLFLIYEQEGAWEEEWRDLQGEPSIVSQLPKVTKETMENAFRGWTRPFVDALGPAPSGLLLTIPRSTRECVKRDSCIFFRAADCFSTAKKLPWCFEPSGFNPAVTKLLAECVKLWREGVYIVVVQEPSDA